MQRLITALMIPMLVCLPACTSSGEVGVRRDRGGYRLDWEFDLNPIAVITNGTDSMACFCIQGLDASGDPIGDPKPAAILPGETDEVPLPQGASRWRADLVNCDELECTKDEERAGSLPAPGFGGIVAAVSQPFYYQEGTFMETFAPSETELVSYTVTVGAMTHQARVDRLWQVVEEESLPSNVSNVEMVKANAVFDSNDSFLGMRLRLIDDDALVNGTRMTVNDNYNATITPLGENQGLWQYEAFVPASEWGTSWIAATTNTVKVELRTVDGESTEEVYTFSWSPLS